jgi:hypothetical protein
MVGPASQVQAMAPKLTPFSILKNLLFCVCDGVTLIRRGTLEKYKISEPPCASRGKDLVFSVDNY